MANALIWEEEVEGEEEDVGEGVLGSDRRQNGLEEALRFSGSTEGRPAMLLLR